MSAAPAIRILLVDDSPIIRLGLRSALEDCPDLAIAGEAGTAGAAAAVANAVNDALGPFGVAITEIPLTPQIILTALGRI